MNLPKGYLSPSQIWLYHTCPECYRWEYVEHAPRPVDVALPIGGSVHRGIEVARRRLLEDGLIDVEEAIDVASEHFDGPAVISDPDSDVEYAVNLKKYNSKGEARDHVVQLMRYAAPILLERDRASGLMGVEVVLTSDVAFLQPRERLRQRLPEDLVGNAFPFPFKGVLDALYGPGVPNQIRDLKTASKAVAPEFGTVLQTCLYRRPLLAAGLKNVVIGIDQLVKTKAPDLRHYWLNSSPEEEERAYQHVLEIADGISAGRFPARPSYLCHYEHGFPGFVVATDGFKEAAA